MSLLGRRSQKEETTELVVSEGDASPLPLNDEDNVESDLEDDDYYNDYTVGGELDDASAGTDVRVLRVINLSQKQKNDELLRAATVGDEYEVGLLLKYGASTKRIDWDALSTSFQLAKDGKDRWTPLHAAARNGHRKICHMLIRAGANVNAQNGWLRSPLHYAAEHGRRNVVMLLLKRGAAVNTIDWHKYTPLHFATMRGHRAVVKSLLEAGADATARTLNMLTALHLAAKRGREDVALMLLDYGADPNARAKLTTPLHEAVKECNASIVRILIDWGADVECRNANRKTPMSIAVLNRDKLSESFLLDAGAAAPHLQTMKPPEDFWPELSPEEGPEGGESAPPPPKKKSLKLLGAKVMQTQKAALG